MHGCVTSVSRAYHGGCTYASRITPGFVQILTIIYPQIATKPGPRRDPGNEHNTVQNGHVPYIQFSTVYMERTTSHQISSKRTRSIYTVQYCIYGKHQICYGCTRHRAKKQHISGSFTESQLRTQLSHIVYTFCVQRDMLEVVV